MEVHNNNCQQFLCSEIDGIVIINGNVIRGAKELCVEKKKLYINSKHVEDYNNVPLKIEITGSVKSIKTASGDITVKGNVTNVKTMSGSVHCQTIEGDVCTMSGSVTCDNIAGACSTMSGNIRR